MNTSKYIFIGLLLIVSIVPLLFIPDIGEILFRYVAENYILSSLVYILLLILSVVVAPFTAPVFLIAGGIFGPFIASIYNILGWGIGAVVAFLLARFFKKSFLTRFVLFNKIEIYEKKIPQDIEFFGIVLLRIMLPVDVLSYALGFFSSISFARYTVATLIGITPFAVIFAYTGQAFFNKEYFMIIIFAGLIFVALFIFSYFFKKNYNK